MEFNGKTCKLQVDFIEISEKKLLFSKYYNNFHQVLQQFNNIWKHSMDDIISMSMKQLVFWFLKLCKNSVKPCFTKANDLETHFSELISENFDLISENYSSLFSFLNAWI